MDINAEINELDREISRAGMLQAQCDIDSGTYWYYEGRTQALAYMRDRLIHQRPEVDSWSRLEMEAMRPRLMPEGIEWLLEVWPKWSNGEYCKFGDWWVSDNYGEPKPKQFRKLSIYTPEQLDEWGQGDGESYGYEWDFLRPSDPKYRPDKVEPPAPEALD